MGRVFSLYNLPGRLIAELWYLWPKNGQIWASGRRRGHRFVHFFYSTVFYLVFAFLALSFSGAEGTYTSEETERISAEKYDLPIEPSANFANMPDTELVAPLENETSSVIADTDGDHALPTPSNTTAQGKTEEAVSDQAENDRTVYVSVPVIQKVEKTALNQDDTPTSDDPEAVVPAPN